MARSRLKITGDWRNPLAKWFRSVRRLSLRKVLAALALLGGLIWLGAHAAGTVRAARAAFPAESGKRSVVGLSAPVSILRDARGIPHIEAAVDADAWQALGFVHGQDRLAQMLWLRRLARGRTAEAVGESGFASDRLARTLGIGRLADRQIEAVAPEAREVLVAYAAGINAQIEAVRAGEVAAPLPLEGGVDAIRDWRPADSLAVLKLIAWSSSNRIETGIVLDELIRVLGGGLAAPFRPGGGERSGASPPQVLIPPPRTSPGHAPEPLSQGLGLSTRIGGGTAWVLGGRYTESGLPLLLADLQLPATTPSLVYEAHLEGPGLSVVGATIPGIPLFWLGRNPNLAWAAITAGAVTADLYMETVREAAASYHDGSGWVPLDIRGEVIRVREATGLREEEITIRSTRHGPLLDAVLEGEEPEKSQEDSRAGGSSNTSSLSLAWTGEIEGDRFSALLAVARSSRASELRAALASHQEPVVAVVYADLSGDAGLQMAGWLPERRLPSGLVPVPARMRIYDWQGRIAYADLPSVRLDASNTPGESLGRSWLIFADGKIGDGLKEAGIEWLWRPGERQRRLNERLSELTGAGAVASPGGTVQRLDLRGAAALQADLGLNDADEVVPAILRLARLGGSLPAEAEEIAGLLSRWDGNLSADSPGATAYSVLNRHLFVAFFESPLGEPLFERYLALPGVRPSMVVGRVLLAADRNRAEGGWAEQGRVVEGLRESLRRTWATLAYRLGPSRSDWSWGNLQGLTFRPFARREAESANDYPAERFAIGGDRNTLASAVSGPIGFDVESVSSYRLAVDLAVPDRLMSALAPGQSEHPRHPHLDDGTQGWRRGQPSPVLTNRLRVEEESAPALLLEPLQ